VSVPGDWSLVVRFRHLVLEFTALANDTSMLEGFKLL
jgi:hypothetical protein